MKRRKSLFTFKSFQDLKALLENKPFSLPEHKQPDSIGYEDKQRPELEEDLFKRAMEGVSPISGDRHVERIFQMELAESSRNREDAEILEKLEGVLMFLTHRNISKAQIIMSIRRLQSVCTAGIIPSRHLLIFMVSLRRMRRKFLRDS
jgi:hypothetical protein